MPPQDNNNVAPLVPKHEKSLSNPLDMTSTGSNPPTSANGYNDFYNNNSSSNQHIYSQLSKSSNELRRSSPNEMYYNNNNNIVNNNNNSPELYKQTPTISANGALVPPPYRDPPPPRNSPMCQGQRLPSSNADTMSNASSSTNPFLSDYDQHSNHNNNSINNNSQAMEEGETMFQATQYNDLLQLIKFQREKITAQQMELQKVRIFFLFRMISYITYCLFILFPSVRYGNSILGEQGTGPRPRARGHIARDLQGGPNLSSRQRTAPDPAVCGGGKRIGQAAGEDSEVGNCSAPIQAGKLRDWAAAVQE